MEIVLTKGMVVLTLIVVENYKYKNSYNIYSHSKQISCEHGFSFVCFLSFFICFNEGFVATFSGKSYFVLTTRIFS